MQWSRTLLYWMSRESQLTRHWPELMLTANYPSDPALPVWLCSRCFVVYILCSISLLHAVHYPFFTQALWARALWGTTGHKKLLVSLRDLVHTLKQLCTHTHCSLSYTISLARTVQGQLQCSPFNIGERGEGRLKQPSPPPSLDTNPSWSLPREAL